MNGTRKGARMRAPFLLLAAAVVTAAAVVASSWLRSDGPRPQTRSGPVLTAERSPLSDCDLIGDPSLLNTDSAVEPHLAVDPRSPDRFVVAWQQDRWSDGAAMGILTAASADGGDSWVASTDTGSTTCTGGSFERATDPWLTFDEERSAHLIYLSVDRDPSATFGISPDAVMVVRSEDGGLSWSDPTELVRSTDPQARNDKPSIAASGGSVFATWSRLDASGPQIAGTSFFARSDDGGQTWSDPVVAYRPPPGTTTLGEQVAPLSETELALVFSEITVDVATGRERVLVRAVRSSDAGESWSDPVDIAPQAPGETVDPFTGTGIVGGRLLPDVAVGPGGNDLYVAWLERADGPYDRVSLARSDDGGATWSDPVVVGPDLSESPPLDRQALLPSVHVLADGTVGVGFFDMRRNIEDISPEDPLEVDLYIAICEKPDCASVTEVRVTEEPLDLRSAPHTSGPFMGDYFGLAGVGAFHVAYVDPTTGETGSAIVHAVVDP